MSVDGLLDEVRRRRTPEEALHVTAILVLAEAGLDRGGEDQLALAHTGWSAVRAEGASDRFPSLSYPTLELVRSGVDLSDDVFLALPEDDQVNVVLMGFLSLVGERLGDEPPAKPAKPPRQARAKRPPGARRGGGGRRSARSDRAVPGRAVEPAGLPAAVRVVVLVLDAGQPVGCRGGGRFGQCVRRFLAARREDGHGGDLEGRCGRLPRPLARPSGRCRARTGRAPRARPVARPAGQLGGPADLGRGVLLEHAQADLLDLVAQDGGALELEVLGGGTHVRLHPGDQRLDLGDALGGEIARAIPTGGGPRGVDLVGLGHRAQPLVDVVDLLDDRRRLDAVLQVVGDLDLAPAVRLVDRRLHRLGHPVGVHDDLAADVPGGAPDHLDQRPGAAQEAFLVGVDDRHQGDLGQVDALAQEVDPDQDVEHAQAEVAQDLDALEGVDLAVEVLDLDPELTQVVGQVLGHLLGQGGDQGPFAALDPAADLLEQVVDLALGRADGDRRVDDAGRPDELLDDPLALLQLIGPGGGAHVHGLVDRRLELLEGQRPVVERGRQAEAEVDQDLLAGPVVLVHAHDLGDRHVALVDDQEPVRREVIQQGPRPRASHPPGEMAAVVLDPGAVAQLAHHLQVERGPLAQPGRLEDPTLGLHLADPQLHLGLDVDERLLELVGGRHEVGRRVDIEVVPFSEQLAGERIDLGDPLDLVAEELDPDDPVVGRRPDLEGVAADPEAGALERLVVALVLQIDQVTQDGVAAVLAALAQAQDGRPVVDRRAQAVDAAHAGDDDHVPPLEQGVGRRVAELVDLVVAAGVLLDVGVRPGQVGLRLVVVEVADEVLDRVVREELAELGVELGSQRLVVREDEGGSVLALDDLGDRERLARAGGAEQRLVTQAVGQTVGQALDGVGLVSGRLEVGHQLEVGHPVKDTRPSTNRTCVLGRRPTRWPPRPYRSPPARRRATRCVRATPVRTRAPLGTNRPLGVDDRRCHPPLAGRVGAGASVSRAPRPTWRGQTAECFGARAADGSLCDRARQVRALSSSPSSYRSSSC